MSLARSKSLRMPSAPREDPALSRQGSMRTPKPRSSSCAPPPPPSSKKPALRPKPSGDLMPPPSLIMRSSSTSNVNLAAPKIPVKFRTLQRGASKENGLMTRSHHGPPLFHQQQQQMKELSDHLKRLTEEHEKLQMEYARLRIQVLESGSLGSSSSLSRDSGVSAESPEEDRTEDQLRTRLAQLENLNQGYQAEMLRAQEEARTFQRRYWEMVLRKDAFEGSQPSAPQQVIELVDKLEVKHRELQETSRNLREAEEALRMALMDHGSCETRLEEAKEWKEELEFMQAERCAMAEGLQEAEVRATHAEAQLDSVQQKLERVSAELAQFQDAHQNCSQQMESLQNALEESRSQSRDVLVSQGAERTMAVLALSQLGHSIQGLVTGLTQFLTSSANISPQVLVDSVLEDGGEENQELPENNNNSEDPGFTLDKGGRSLVQAMIEAIEQHATPPRPSKPSRSLSAGATPRTALENQLRAVNGQLSKVSSLLGLLQSHYMECRSRCSSLEQQLGETDQRVQQLSQDLAGRNSLLDKYVSHFKDKSQTKEVLQKQNESLSRDLEELREVCAGLRAVNEEQSRQLREEVGKSEDTFQLVPLDKLILQQEVCKLQESLKYKDQQVQALTSKIQRNRKVLEDNWAKAEREVQRMDRDLGLVYQTLTSHPDVLAKYPEFRQLYINFGGDPSLLDITNNKAVTTV